MATFLYRAQNRIRWERTEGDSPDGPYVAFGASVDLTEFRWRPEGLTLMVRCTDALDADAPELDVSAFGYGGLSWFWGERGESGVIEYQFGDEAQSTLVVADISEDKNALFVPDDHEERFLSAMDADTSGELFLSLFDERYDGSLDVEVEGLLSVAGYREHVKPFVEACD